MLAQTWIMTGRGLRRSLRSPQLIIGTLAFPLLMFLMMLAAFGRLVTDFTGMPYVERLTPVIVLATAAFPAPVAAVGFFADVHGGIVDRLRAMPVNSMAVLAGRVLTDVCRGLVVALLATLAGMIFGFRFATFAGLVGFLVTVLVFGAAVSWVAVLVALRSSGVEAIQAVLDLPITLLFVLSSGFVPANAFPGWSGHVVAASPLSRADEALIQFALGRSALAPFLEALAWLVVIGGLAMTFALRRYRALLQN
jgi:ABC-2 type transport system permease protein